MREHRASGAPGQVKEITSLANPLIKDIKALSLKKYRDQQNAFIAEGLKLIIDAFELGWSIRTLIFAKAARDNKAVQKAASRTVAAGGTVLEVTDRILTAITRRDNPQAVVGVFSQRLMPLDAIRPAGDDVWVALDRVRDPGNLGTIIRTVDAVGAKGVILVGETTDPFSLETVRATMGSIFAVPVAKASTEDFLVWRQSFPGLVAGTHLKGAVDYRSVDFGGKPVLLLMGNEQQGLPDALARSCDRLLRIPQAGRADSLNLAVATGVMLFEIRRNGIGSRRGCVREVSDPLLTHRRGRYFARSVDQVSGRDKAQSARAGGYSALHCAFQNLQHGGGVFDVLVFRGHRFDHRIARRHRICALSRQPRRGLNRLVARLGFALIIGGAIGNLIDRAIHGHVIDYILFHTPVWSFAVFNLADALITVGAILVVADEFLGWSKQRNSDRPSAD